MRRILLSLVLLLLLSSQVFAAPMSASGVAVVEGQAFLALLDQRRYADAWSVGTNYFKSQLSVEKWQQILEKYREPLGRVRARRKLSARYIGSFESAPPGIYMQVEFRSTFGRTERLERLVVKQDVDGRWRITGYQLR